MTTRLRAARAAALIAVWATLACVAGCAALPDARTEPFGLDFPRPEALADREPLGAIVFFVDGVNPKVFDAMLKAGELPNLKRYLVDRGRMTLRAVANTPSVTLANETSFVTGVFPGRHGVTGINWFDRNRLVWRNYETIAQKNTLDGDYRTPTVYEHLEDETTLSLFFQAHRGATKFVENWTSAGPPYFFGWYDMVDRISLLRFRIVSDIAARRGAWPAFAVCYLLMPDLEAYRSGVVESRAYHDALVHTDAHLGRVFRELEAAGLLDRMVLALVSDHNMHDVARHWPVEPFLRDDLDLSVARDHLWEETQFEDRLDYYRRFACVVYGSGERYVAVCLRKPKPGGGFENWLARPEPDDLRAYPTEAGGTVDLVRTFRDAEAVDVVAYRPGTDRVHLVTRRGLVELVRTPGSPERFAYQELKGDDPLGYAAAGVPTEMLLGKAFDGRAWLRATLETDYPDLVPQIMAYFDAPRAGDLVLFAMPGWDFGTRLKAGHGGLRPADMFTPLVLAGPGVPRGTFAEPVRTVDVMPTLLDLLGKPVPSGLDGRSLVPVMRGAAPAGR